MQDIISLANFTNFSFLLTRVNPPMTTLKFDWLKRINGVRKAKRRAKKVLERARKGNTAYGQEGEDLVLASLFFRLNGMKSKTTGFYVDVGAHHPFTYSNTAVLSKWGWSGVNIDPSPDAFKLFEIYRPNDINVQSGVGVQAALMKYFAFRESALNTFDSDIASRHESTGRKVTSVTDVPVKPLADILDNYMLGNRKIDFLNVDVEGFDLDVLKSNNWEKYMPSIIAIEQHSLSLKGVLDSDVSAYLEGFGYCPWAKTASTVFYVSKTNIPYLSDIS